MPAYMTRMSVMKYVGGYASLRALEEYTSQVDAREWGRVLIAMAGEADAQQIMELERRAQAVHPPR